MPIGKGNKNPMDQNTSKFNFFSKKAIIIIAIVALLVTNIATALVCGFIFGGEESDGSGEENNGGDTTELVTMTSVEINEKYADSICEISSDYMSGTGFVGYVGEVGDSENILYVITNYHVVSGIIDGSNANFSLLFSDSEDAITQDDISLCGYDIYHDVAVLKVSDKSGIDRVEIMKTMTGDVTTGDDLTMIGNLEGLGESVFGGLMSNADKVLDFGSASEAAMRYRPVYQVSVNINEGCSGSPVFDSFGRVVGMGSYQEPYDDDGRPTVGVSYAVPANILQPLVLKAIAGKDGEAVNKISYYYDSYDVLNVSDLMFKVDVTTNDFIVTEMSDDISPTLLFAEGEWLASGDKILSIDGMSVEGISSIEFCAIIANYVNVAADYASGLDDYLTSSSIILTFERDGETYELQFKKKALFEFEM